MAGAQRRYNVQANPAPVFLNEMKSHSLFLPLLGYRNVPQGLAATNGFLGAPREYLGCARKRKSTMRTNHWGVDRKQNLVIAEIVQRNIRAPLIRIRPIRRPKNSSPFREVLNRHIKNMQILGGFVNPRLNFTIPVTDLRGD